jgi:hypothetical protein
MSRRLPKRRGQVVKFICTDRGTHKLRELAMVEYFLRRDDDGNAVLPTDPQDLNLEVKTGKGSQVTRRGYNSAQGGTYETHAFGCPSCGREERMGRERMEAIVLGAVNCWAWDTGRVQLLAPSRENALGSRASSRSGG